MIVVSFLRNAVFEASTNGQRLINGKRYPIINHSYIPTNIIMKIFAPVEMSISLIIPIGPKTETY